MLWLCHSVTGLDDGGRLFIIYCIENPLKYKIIAPAMVSRNGSFFGWRWQFFFCLSWLNSVLLSCFEWVIVCCIDLTLVTKIWFVVNVCFHCKLHYPWALYLKCLLHISKYGIIERCCNLLIFVWFEVC